ncbi:TPA: Vir protein [Legionella pneumophila]|nr:Vir protein [Legionella pneumophila]HAT8117165.1 Vir protein [Legionella pneumophila]HAT8130757.1 Vir protein [Legionella pneumophila]HAT8150775.1 Vir protein [Legionella pneumophila]HAT8154920.1 Vir protein [Legionella pneumophila]
MTTSSTLAPTEEGRKRIDRLFLRFAAMYGQVWRSQFKSDEFLVFVKGEWQQGLFTYADNILDMAIDLCRKNKELPPTLPQFIDFCKNCSKRSSFFVPVAAPKNNNPEVAKTQLLKMKHILNMKVN